MNICRKITNKVFVFSLYPPLVSKPENIFIESNSKTNAITRVFESYCINSNTINNVKGFYFTKDLEMKEMDLKQAFIRRIVWGD